MKRRSNPDSSGDGRTDFRANICFVIATGCLLGVIAIARVHASQEGSRRDPGGQIPSLEVAASEANSRTKIAEGEYAVYEEGNSGAVGPAGEEVYDFRESWTLWRNGKEQFEAEGERKFESPRDVKHSDRFVIELSRDMTPIRTTEFAKLAWRRDSGPTTCEFLPKQVHCFSSGGSNEDAQEVTIQMQPPYGFLWPISPFSLSGLTREAERDLNRPNSIQLLSIEQPSPINPVYPIVRSGQLQYLGEETIRVAELSWRAHKFSLKVPSYPQFLIWTSSEGLLLSVAVEHADPNWPKEGMKLSRYRKWAEF